ncbi:sensor domain-containing protein [Nocardia sp. NPDC051570]|uniref:sensor domain-containing protein n=1 Tax=Nocardia sp. NPDC051570 TaxID=3364324 RepID=UPI0037A26FCA
MTSGLGSQLPTRPRTGGQHDPSAMVRGPALNLIRGLAMAMRASAALALFAAAAVVCILSVTGIGLLAVPLVIPLVRRLSTAERRSAARWGVLIESPYRPVPCTAIPFEDGIVGWVRRCRWLLTDPATWRDLLWLPVDSVVGLIGLLPVVCLYATGVALLQGSTLWHPASSLWYVPNFGQNPTTELWALPLGVALLTVWVWISPTLFRWHALLAGTLLGPTKRAFSDELPATRPRIRPWFTTLRTRATHAGIATLFGAVVAAASEVCLALVIVNSYTLLLMIVGVGVLLLPAITAAVRWLCSASRKLAEYFGAQVDEPYRPEPDGLNDGLVGLVARCRWLLTDPATWRDLLWMLANAILGLLCLLPAALLYYVGEGVVLAAGLWRPLADAGHPRWYGPILVQSQAAAVAAACFAVALFVVWLWFAPFVLRTHALFTAALLRPTGTALLTARAKHLAETREDAIETQAAELRRIERDLHDGAQARLVAMGLALGAAERQLDTNPDRARKLIAETRASSASALAELRDLVRGIHPPVLAERGLPDALRALALASPLSTRITVTIPGIVSPAIAAAVYFAVSELMTNVLKHAEAEHIDITASYENGKLSVRVADDGNGGADLNDGSGLAGLRRRLAAFDGTVAVDSPRGGPTVVDMEVPCVLS